MSLTDLRVGSSYADVVCIDLVPILWKVGKCEVNPDLRISIPEQDQCKPNSSAFCISWITRLQLDFIILMCAVSRDSGNGF